VCGPRCHGGSSLYIYRVYLLRYLARRASDKKRGRDGTKYSKFHLRGYLSHHLAAISMAAVYTDAVHIADGVVGLKQRSLAASDPTA
jgi:hypothetical protein